MGMHIDNKNFRLLLFNIKKQESRYQNCLYADWPVTTTFCHQYWEILLLVDSTRCEESDTSSIVVQDLMAVDLSVRWIFQLRPIKFTIGLRFGDCEAQSLPRVPDTTPAQYALSCLKQSSTSQVTQELNGPNYNTIPSVLKHCNRAFGVHAFLC